ncbi:threonine-phosphate decarboxylase CobD [Rhizobium sp. C4]|uniref:threonine-phosphate decarboxylase CobD n=1 Tax=Rhizobium sp. C4 TaxID=1349800 RepID=UPI001E2D3874|nr:threonine-phosphate decarboxylase CobD [Rhizobium sp. C4]MCD2173324.1 threonine-phosphate decarboxylase CobD [Rhizobium sp. C4]
MSGVFHGGGVSAAARAFGIAPENWLDLSTGINPVPPALPAFDPQLFHRLPDADLHDDVRRAAGRFYGSGEVLPIAAAGTQPLIRLLASNLGKGRVAILSPTYGEYRAVFSAAGHHVDEIATLAAVTADHQAVVVVNPNNPDGRLYSRADLLALSLDLAERGATLVVDEAFGEMHPEASLAGVVAHHPHLVVLKSFGKFFGFAGARLSFAIAGDRHAGPLEAGLGPWPVSGPALALARHCFGLDAQEIRREIWQRAAGLEIVIAGAGLRVRANAGLFLLIETPDAASLFDHLGHHGILTRIFDYGSDWMRIGLPADQGELDRLALALQDWNEA